MKRYVAVVEELDWAASISKVRIPSKDGIDTLASTDPGFVVLNQLRSPTSQLQDATIPYHLRGLRLGDVVLVLESEDTNDDYSIVGFYGGTYKE